VGLEAGFFIWWEVNKMATMAVRREDIMTDYQFKTILKMVLDLAESSNDIEKIKKSLRDLIGEKTETAKDSERYSERA
jgi:hypothetical protein